MARTLMPVSSCCLSIHSSMRPSTCPSSPITSVSLECPGCHAALAPAEPLRKEGPLDPGQRLPSGPPAPLWALARCPLQCLIRSLGARDPVCPSHQSFQVPSPHRPSLSSREVSVTALCSEGPAGPQTAAAESKPKTVCVCVRARVCMLALMSMYVQGSL